MNGSTLLAHGYLLAYASVFVGGVLTSLTPCVYPLISITVSLFGARDEKATRARAMLLGALYVAGIAVTYTALGIGFALTGRQFGSFMSKPAVIIPLALFLLAMAASMFGAFDISLPSSLQTRLSKVGGRGFLGAFTMGLVGGIIAAPCTGPVLASVLAFVAYTRSVAVGASLLFTYALGMGVLFFMVAAFAQQLPRSGAWMEKVKSVFGIIMVVAALYFLRNVIPALGRIGSTQISFALVSVLLFGVGLWLGAFGESFREQPIRKGFGVLMASVGGFGLVAALLAVPNASAEMHPLHWNAGAEATLAEAAPTHKPVLIDFFADWCLPCKEVDKKTLHDPRVELALQPFAVGKVDCSNDEDPVVVAAQKKYDAATLPTLVVLDKNGQVAAHFDRPVTPEELLPVLARVTQ